MNLVIVRPIEKFQETKQVFLNTSQKIYSCPVTRIDYLEVKDFPNNPLNVVFFTSEFAIKALKNLNIKPPLKAYCIGKATQKSALDYGIPIVKIPECFDGVSLAQLIINDLKDFPHDIIYCAGFHRKSHFENELINNNIRFKLFELYKAQELVSLDSEIQQLLMQDNNVDFLCYSMRSAVILLKLIKQFKEKSQIKSLLTWRIVGKKSELSQCLSCEDSFYFFDSPYLLEESVKNQYPLS